MNMTQMHERLRVELVRRIQRGTLSVSLLSRQTGFGQSHLSNFLNCRRQLSLQAMDRILYAQHIGAGDLLPAHSMTEPLPMQPDLCAVPVVSQSAAATEPFIRPGAIHALLHLPASVIQSARSHAPTTRRMWQRFIAVRISPAEALPMEPVVLPDAYAVIDRHYNALTPYRPHKPTLYAVRRHTRLAFRYLDFQAGRLILRPHNRAFPVELIEIEPDAAPAESIIGRVLMILNET